MSWNFTLGIVPNSSIADVVDGRELAPQVVSFDEVQDALGVAQLGADVVLLDPHGYLLSEFFAGWAEEHAQTAYSVTLGGYSDVYFFEQYGAKRRLRVQMQGEVAEDQGEPLAAEADMAKEEFPEDAHIVLIERLLNRPFKEVFEAPFQMLKEK